MAVFGRLIFCLALLVGLFAPRVVFAADPPYDDAVASVYAFMASHPCPYDGVSLRCAYPIDSPSEHLVGVQKQLFSNGVWEFSSWMFIARYSPLDDDQCRARSTIMGPVDNIGGGHCDNGCLYKPQSSSPERWGVRNADGSMRWVGSQPWSSVGLCPAAAPLPPMPPVITTLCGGASCHDVGGGQYCAGVEGGGQVCVSDKPPPQGACASSGDTTLCVGNPPPTPPNPPVSDPPTDFAGGDKYGHDPGNGGPITNTTINNFGNGGSGSANNGGTEGPGTSMPPAGDPGGPAPSGSTGKPGGSFGGGGDCSAPPMCTGDPVLCGIALQQWRTMCSAKDSADGLRKDLSDFSGDGDNTVPGLEGVGEGPGEGFITESSLLDKLDSTGFGGGGVCPGFPAINIPMFHVEGSSEPPIWWCDILGGAGKVIMLLAAFFSLRLLAER